MPLPAVIQFTAPGSIVCTVPRLSRCTIAPSNRYVTVAKSDMRMRPHVRTLPRSERYGTEMIEEDERTDHLGGRRRQQPLHDEAAEVASVGS